MPTILKWGRVKFGHDVVLWSIDQGYAGLENLSLIPGSVGAAPVQNIGAYGVELVDRLFSLEAVDLDTGKNPANFPMSNVSLLIGIACLNLGSLIVI